MRFYKNNSVFFHDVVRSNVMKDYICHYGRKGMKWYQHIFGKADNVKNPIEKKKKNK